MTATLEDAIAITNRTIYYLDSTHKALKTTWKLKAELLILGPGSSWADVSHNVNLIIRWQKLDKYTSREGFEGLLDVLRQNYSIKYGTSDPLLRQQCLASLVGIINL